jgi:hypothetical protein
VLCLLSICAIAACNTKDKVPSFVIEKPKLVLVLSDLHVLETNEKFKSSSTAWKDSAYSLFFEKHKIDKKILEQNIDYYSEESIEFEDIYNDLIINLNQNNIK